MKLTSILWVLSGMYENWFLWAKVFGLQWGQNRSIYRIPSIFLKIFCWIQLELHLQAHWSYLWRYVKDKPRGSNFWAIWNLQMSQNSSFRIYCWKVSSVFTSVFLYVLLAVTFRDVYNMCIKGPIPGPFWAPKKVKILMFGHFLKMFSLVSHQYCFPCSLHLLLDVWRILASEAQFIGHFGP